MRKSLKERLRKSLRGNLEERFRGSLGERGTEFKECGELGELLFVKGLVKDPAIIWDP